MDKNPVKFHCNKKEGMTRRKDVYHGTLGCFIYVLICHVPIYHVLQLHNKLQNIDMSAFFILSFSQSPLYILRVR
jgi:hypothetical protein